MVDKSWMLNSKAIAAAKKCICVVNSELGVKLKLSHPDFLELLVDFAELNESDELQKSLTVLAQFAPAPVNVSLTQANDSVNILNLEAKSISMRRRSNSVARSQLPQADVKPLVNTEVLQASKTVLEPTVFYNGKNYPRYRGGAEFKGLYRGQPNYV